MTNTSKQITIFLPFEKYYYLHTGDIGVIEEGKFLRITDPKKEMFKLSAGKYIAPQVIENKLKESFFIEQAMVTEEWTPLTRELSPTLKLKRTYLTKEYKDIIAEIYFSREKDLNVPGRIKNGINGVLKNLSKFQVLPFVICFGFLCVTQ